MGASRTPDRTASPVEAVRRFNRFYTRAIGVLKPGLLDSPFPLPQARLIFELAQYPGATASELRQALGLDPGYVSRLLAGLARNGVIARRGAPEDGRRSLLSLTARGRAALATLERRSRAQIASLLAPLAAAERERVVAAMRTIETALSPASAAATAFVLRPHRIGDWGWIVARHGTLYAKEFGWDESFEGMVAGIVGGIVERFDARRERVWIAERDGFAMGSVCLVAQSRRVARLRLLLVEPGARGLGVGRALVEECPRFARQAGYRKITLWTHDVLVQARRLYERAGFKLVRSEPRRRRFGVDLVSETWELAL